MSSVTALQNGVMLTGSKLLHSLTVTHGLCLYIVLSRHTQTHWATLHATLLISILNVTKHPPTTKSYKSLKTAEPGMPKM